MIKYTALIFLGLSLSACASGAKIEAMNTGPLPYTSASATAPVKEAIVIGNISGGSETYALWKSNVSTENFREALSQSLKANSLLASDAGKYRLDANLADLDQPILGGFNMTVTAHVNYKITEIAKNSAVFEETVATPFTANFSDNFMGYERLRLANEGAIRENIMTLITKINAAPGLGK